MSNNQVLSRPVTACFNKGMDAHERRKHNLKRVLFSRFEGRSIDLATRLGISPSYLSRLFTKNEESRRNVGENSAREYERKLGLKSGWLDENHGLHNVDSIPGADFAFSAPIEANNGSSWPFTQQVPGGTPATVKHEVAEGDAMAPTIVQGDVLLIDQSVKKISADGIYLLTILEQSHIRRVRRGLDGTIHLLCDNESYPAHDIKPDKMDSLEILGRVIGVWRYKTL